MEFTNLDPFISLNSFMPFIQENFKFILFQYVKEVLSYPKWPDTDPH